MNEAFTGVAELDNVVVFIDEVEEVASRRGPHSPAATAVVNELLKCLVQFRDRAGRLLICATNSVGDLDAAFLRHGRFDYVMPIGPPDEQARDALWRRLITDSDIDMPALIAATRGYTPADITHAARAVAQASFERTVDSGVRSHAGTQDYLRIIDATRPTLTADQVSQFDADIDTYARV
ncbi:ATP-binding protein [Mycobacterium sp. AZCC_0083]|uniref:AAA family ATPase n=1 Tax=Mycobacterium sp. AZCC_0083 TaxID=2735882 RepID=UPI0017C2DC07|nr:ATP-binding protein [Mycobacterium sp. AZCC_0083]MBB5164490.1 SpoVK/Ycf46/Vps4 family AAA+-type ATPase [Mycobacterium sp. AZCC_0083]